MNIRFFAIMTLLLLAAPPLTAAEPTLWRDMLTQKAVGPPDGGEWSEPAWCLGVERQARLLNADLVVGEPLVVFLRITGVSDNPAEHGGRFAVGQDVRIYIVPHKSGAGGPYEYVPARRPLPVLRSTFKMSKGERIDIPFICAFDPNTRSGAVFDSSGTYTVVFSSTCDSSSENRERLQELGRFEVSVRMPQPGEDDLVALNAMMQAGDFETFKSLQALAFYDPAHEAVFESIVETAPNAALRPYALAALGKGLSGRSFDDLSLRPRVEAVLRRYLEEYPEGLLAKDIADSRIRLLLAEGRDDEALELFGSVYHDPWIGPKLLEGDPLVRTFVGKAKEDVRGNWMVTRRPEDAQGIVRTAEQEMTDALVGQLPASLTESLGRPVGIEIGSEQ